MHVLVYNTGIAQNELICGYANVVHTRTHACTHTKHTHILIPFEDSVLMGLKVDIAKNKNKNKSFKLL